jgi:hypothetical protein
MTARRTRTARLLAEPIMTPAEVAGRTIPTASVVMGIVVRAAGIVPVRERISRAAAPARARACP